MTSKCLICGGPALESVLSAPAVPVSNRYPRAAGEVQELFPLELSVCSACGLSQLSTTIAPEHIRPRGAAVLYNEPEAHLDAVVEKVAALPGVTKASRFLGLTYKEDTTLARLRALGFSAGERLDPAADLGVTDDAAGLETFQEALTGAAVDSILRARKQFDVVMLRHIFEHAHAPARFLANVARLVKDDGYLVIEVPDCAAAFDLCDYAVLWEEHILYFTPDTLRSTLSLLGYSVVDLTVHPLRYENSLVAIVKKGGQRAEPAPLPPKAAGALRNFSASFQPMHAKLQEFFLGRVKDGISLFGAGHLATMFVNLFDLQPYIRAGLDDDPKKRGLYLPGTKAPIEPSAALSASASKLCLLSMNPGNEDKVLARHAAYLQAGGTFASIFPSSARAIFSALE